MTSGCLCRIALAAGLVAGAAPLSAGTYPARPVKIVVSTSPGGITDIAARILGMIGSAEDFDAFYLVERASGKK